MQTTSNSIKRLLVVMRAGGAIGAGTMLLHWLFDVMAAVVRATLAGAPVRADEALTGLAAGTAALLVLWGVVGVLLVAVGTVPGAMGDAARTASASLTPRLLRRCVGVVLGVGAVAGIAPGVSVATAPATRVLMTARPLPDPGWSAPMTPTTRSTPPDLRSRVAPSPRPPHPASTPTRSARPSPSSPASSRPSPPRGDILRPGPAPTTRPAQPTPPAHIPHPGWVPPAPTVRPQPDVRLLGPPPASADPGEVVVRRGDTLWAIAARQLGPEPSDAEIAEAWPAWHDANREVVGDDPDRLLPGQVLRSPHRAAS